MLKQGQDFSLYYKNKKKVLRNVDLTFKNGKRLKQICVMTDSYSTDLTTPRLYILVFVPILERPSLERQILARSFLERPDLERTSPRVTKPRTDSRPTKSKRDRT